MRGGGLYRLLVLLFTIFWRIEHVSTPRGKRRHQTTLRPILLLGFFFIVMLNTQCARYPALPELKEGVPIETLKSEDEAQLDKKMRSVLLNLKTEKSSKDYVIGISDVLLIEIWQQSELTKQAKVTQDGSFSYPLLNTVKASGLTVAELEAELPQVTVSVQQYASKSVYLLGAVRRVGEYPLKVRTTLLEIITQAGGLTEDAGLTCIVIRPKEKRETASPVMPQQAEQEEAVSVNLKDLMKGDLVQNVELQDGDTVFVPRSQNYFVFGEVQKPGKYKYDTGITVLKAITEAGGPTEKAASLKRVRIIREQGGKKIRIPAHSTDNLKPQDIVIVPETFF